MKTKADAWCLKFLLRIPFSPNSCTWTCLTDEQMLTYAFVLLEVAYSFPSSTVCPPMFCWEADVEMVAVVRLFSSRRYFSDAKSLILLFPKGILQIASP